MRDCAVAEYVTAETFWLILYTLSILIMEESLLPLAKWARGSELNHRNSERGQEDLGLYHS